MFPVILYDINRKQIVSNIIPVIGNTFYLYSPTEFKIEILKTQNYNACLYSVQVVNGELKTFKADEFIDSSKLNIGYTIAFNIDDKYKYGVSTELDIRVSNDTGYSKDYKFVLVDESKLPAHYNDIITNNYLPTFEELEPAILTKPYSDNKRELIKRLLLDFKHILRSKGTKESIRKFLKFIGFQDKQIKIFEEYIKLDESGNEIGRTLNPDRTKDVKSGNYSVLYDNWNTNSEIEFDNKNLPILKYGSENIQELLECLSYAIPLANKFFTAVEQDIIFFGVRFGSNIHQIQSVKNMFDRIFVTDIFGWRKKLNINFFTKKSQIRIDKDGNRKTIETKHILVNNCLQKHTDTYKTETKYIDTNVFTEHKDLFLIDKEISDGDVYENEDIMNYKRCFGVCIHGKIYSPNTYVGIEITSVVDPKIKLVQEPTFIIDYFEPKFITKIIGDFNIKVTIIDTYGNKDSYKYRYNVSSKKARIGFDLYSTQNLNEDIHANTDLDISSGTIKNKQLGNSINYILDVDTIPDELSKYFEILPGENLRYLTEASTHRNKNNPLYFVESINKNILTKDVSEVPIQFTEQYLEFAIFEEDIEQVTKDFKKLLKEQKQYFDDSNSTPDKLQFDKLFISKLNIYRTIHDNEATNEKDVLFVCGVETGIDLEFLYSEVFKIHNYKKYRIPVNYDFPLFSNTKVEYQPENCYSINVENLKLPVVRSFFPRMTKQLFSEVKQGDTILVRLNSDYVVDEVNPIWNIKNSFTGEIVFTTTDYTLKYRVNDNCSYDITVEFDIYDEHYIIDEQGIFTSYLITE